MPIDVKKDTLAEDPNATYVEDTGDTGIQGLRETLQKNLVITPLTYGKLEEVAKVIATVAEVQEATLESLEKTLKDIAEENKKDFGSWEEVKEQFEARSQELETLLKEAENLENTALKYEPYATATYVKRAIDDARVVLTNGLNVLFDGKYFDKVGKDAPGTSDRSEIDSVNWKVFQKELWKVLLEKFTTRLMNGQLRTDGLPSIPVTSEEIRDRAIYDVQNLATVLQWFIIRFVTKIDECLSEKSLDLEEVKKTNPLPWEPILHEKEGITPAGYVALVRALGLLLDRNVVVLCLSGEKLRHHVDKYRHVVGAVRMQGLLELCETKASAMKIEQENLLLTQEESATLAKIVRVITTDCNPTIGGYLPYMDEIREFLPNMPPTHRTSITKILKKYESSAGPMR